MIEQNLGLGRPGKFDKFWKSAVDQMLSTAGYSVTNEDVQRIHPRNWPNKYTMSRANKETFKAWFLTNYKTTYPKLMDGDRAALRNFNLFFDRYGLKVRT